VTQPLREPPALHDRAIQDLSFIRRTMEGATSFTDVSGQGLVLLGLLALGAAGLASQQPTVIRWLAVWLLAALLGGSLSLGMNLRKMRRRQPEGSGLSVPARKFLFGFWPAIAAGAVLTFAIIPGFVESPYAGGLGQPTTLLAGIWLLLYGVGVMGAGAFSVRAVPLLGVVFIGLGTLTLLLPSIPADLMLAAGFGLAQIVAGVYIARSYGG